MPSSEFAEWLAYEKISPGDPERSDIRTAQLCKHIYDAHREPRSKRFEIDDFVLEYGVQDRTPERKSPEQMKTMLAAFFNGLIARGKGKKNGK